MMPIMNRALIERAESVASKLEALSKRFDIAEEAKGYERPKPKNLEKSAKVGRYEFTDRQLEIAEASLDAKDSV